MIHSSCVSSQSIKITQRENLAVSPLDSLQSCPVWLSIQVWYDLQSKVRQMGHRTAIFVSVSFLSEFNHYLRIIGRVPRSLLNVIFNVSLQFFCRLIIPFITFFAAVGKSIFSMITRSFASCVINLKERRIQY